MSHFVAILLVVIALAVRTMPAAAFETFSPEDRRAVANGEIIVRVEPDPAGATGRIAALFEIAATPAAVWAVMTDCPRSLRYVKGLTACNVLSTEAGGKADVREHVINRLAVLPTVRSIFRTEYDPPREMRFQRAGGDLTALEGRWRLQSVGDGRRTRLAYEARIGINSFVPGGVLRSLIQSETASTLADLKSEVERGPKP